MRRRWGLAAIAAVALAVGALANAADGAHLATGFATVVHGNEGEDVSAGSFQVHVHGATASTEVEDLDGTVTSAGSFVVVDVSYATTDAWATPEEIVLVDADGREFSDPSSLGLGGSPWMAGPDIWFRGQLLFEVPADTLDSLVLEYRPESLRAILPSTVARIPLTVTEVAEPLEVGYDNVLGEGLR